MSAHPVGCPKCAGTGHVSGPPIIETVNGQPHPYTTVTPCEHDWWNDDTGYDPHLHDPLSQDHARAIDARNRGIIIGRAELFELSGGLYGAPPPLAAPPAPDRYDDAALFVEKTPR